MNKTTNLKRTSSISLDHRQKVFIGQFIHGKTFAVLILLLLTLVASQDFLLADINSAIALKSWWVDASFHIVNINSLSDLIQGSSQIGNLESGAGSSFYHFLSYIPSALGCVVFGLTPIQSYALIYAPLAMFLFATGVWLFASACWSRETALWATLLMMLLPDFLPYLLTSHDFLRLKWLIAVSPGLGYGVFVSALAWVLCLKGIRENAPRYVAYGFFLCLLTILVKAHLFVANALPLVIYTIAFFPNLQKTHRFMLLGFFSIAYLTAIWLAASFLNIPLIQYDFSNMVAYASRLLDFQPLDVVSSWLLSAVTELPVYAAPFILALALTFMHFGGLFLLTVFLFWRDAGRGNADRWLPAIFIFAVYILHAVSLAQDSRAYTYSGASNELIHRPFVWGVSLILVWTFASLAETKSRFFSMGPRWILAAALIFPGIYTHNGMQFSPYWTMPRVNYSDAYFEALHFVENHATGNELVQAANLDPYLATWAVTGHRAYVSRYSMKRYPSKETLARSEEVLYWLNEIMTPGISSFAQERNISWLITPELTVANWPPEIIANHTRFRKDDILVLQFPPKKTGK